MKKRLTANYKTKYYLDYIHTRLSKKYGLTYPEIAKIISLYHEYAREDMSKGEPMYLKKKLGNLQIHKEKREVTINKKGEIINKLPINFIETWKLWKSKPELRHKTYVRFVNKHSNGFYFRLTYQLSKATYKYKLIYNFKFNATLKKMLAQNIFNKDVDAYVKSF